MEFVGEGGEGRWQDMHSCEKGLKVQPEIGSVLLWYSLRPNGNSDPLPGLYCEGLLACGAYMGQRGGGSWGCLHHVVRNSLHASCPVPLGHGWTFFCCRAKKDTRGCQGLTFTTTVASRVVLQAVFKA